MGISEGSQHTAEVCGDVLHYVGEGHILFLARCVQNEESERQEREQRHVVCDQHRADKCDVDKSKHRKAQIAESLYDLLRYRVEESYVAKSTHHRKNAEKTGQRLEVKVFDIFLVRRNEEHSDDSRHSRDHRDRVVLQHRQN